MKRKTIGSSDDNELVLAHPSIAKVHAEIELANDGSIYVTSTGPAAPIWLLREGQRLRTRRICLSLDDRLMLGEQEIGLAQVTSLFEAASGARLRHRKEAPRTAVRSTKPVEQTTPATSPRRNPVTGAIES